MEINEMTIEALEERKAAIATEVESPEADLDALEAEARSIKEELEARKAAEAKRAEIRNAVAAGAGTVTFKVVEKEEKSTMEIRNSEEYINAFANYVKTGDDAECRALLTENVSGTVPVPTFVAGIVAERLKASQIINRCRKMEAPGVVKVGFEISAPLAAAHIEGDEAVSEEELTLGIVTMPSVTLKKWISISDEALESMNGRAYLEYLYDEVSRGIVKALEKSIVEAILAAPQTATATAPAVAKTGSAAGAITDFVDARALLSSAAEDLVIIVTPAQYATYKGLQMAANYGVDPFDGLPVLFSDYATAPIIGDLSGIMVNYPKGANVEFKFDDKTLMTSDLVRVLGRLPVARGVVGNLFFAKVAA